MRIAIIGSGISGLTSAYLLQHQHEIHIYEKENWIGGHTHTLDVVEDSKTLAIDTGFIVFNDKTYPNFNKLIDQLNVPKQKTHMSFSVSNQLNGLEYNGTSLHGLFAQKKNIFNYNYLKMLYHITQLNTLAKELVLTHTPHTLKSFIEHYNIDSYTVDNYLLPMCCAIWSCKKEQILATPIQFLFSFLNNHGMLNINDRPQWYVIKNGSREYVRQLETLRTIQYHKNNPVLAVWRENNQIILKTKHKNIKFDKIIFATHANDTLKLLKSPLPLEQEVLSYFPYQNNQVTLHTDISVLPHNKKAWACWNFLIDKNSHQQCRLSYNMNLLQGLASKKTYCVSVNQNDLINTQDIIEQFDYAHPVYTTQAFQAQKRQAEISGRNNIFYCGAYWGYGFHEDGVKSALHISKQLGGLTL